MGDLRIFKAFVGHYVTPVACAVADAEKDWFVLCFGLGKGFLTPWIPVHRIVGVLEQIRAGLML